MVRLTVAAGALAALAFAAAPHASARGLDGREGFADRTVHENYQGDDDEGRAGRMRGRDADNARPFVPLEFIIGQIQARTPGRLVGVRGPNGQGIYRIVWETPDGRVITFVVDGRTGQILR